MLVELVPAILELPEGDPRSSGLHASGIIRCIAGEAGILAPEYCEDLSLMDLGQQGWWESLSAVNKLRIMIGLAWEAFYAGILAKVLGLVFHPGEFCIDGIYMTPDGESLDIVSHTGLVGHEFKATYKSTKTVGDLESQWMWLAQAKAYAKALKTLVMYLHVLFLCGNYTYPIQPQLKCWRITFTPEEIDDNWDLFLSYVRHRAQAERETT